MSALKLAGLLLLLVPTSAGCAASRSAPLTPAAGSVVSGNAQNDDGARCDMKRDQRAIASMAGSYDVEFDFEETEVLTPGYLKKPPHKSYATELVLVVENTPGVVSLQHILQLGAGPSATIIKHWRQDWVFEDRELMEFRGREIWDRRTLSAEEARCTWSQAVYGVDDAPRYDGFGRWQHDEKGSIWTSNETWRPLPRREYSTRNDYDVLVAVNRHRITKNGWDHEQENSKLVLEPRHTLVRERGRNRYTRANPADTKEAAAYWEATAPFWKEVRAEWQRVFATNGHLNLQSEASGKRLHEALFERADAKQPVDAATIGFIHDTLERYVVKASLDASSTAKAP